MSKSLGNSLDPVELIDQHGADALRFTLMAQMASGKDLKFSSSRLEGYRNFINKIWNATRFSLKALEGFEVPSEGLHAKPAAADLSVSDQWITYRLGEAEKQMHEALKQHRFSDAVNAIYSFVWNDFCDWYLEFSKPVIYGEESSEKSATQLVLAQTLNRIMRLLHPFTPFVTEEIYQKLPIKSDALVIAEYPTPENDKEWLSIGNSEAAFEMEVVKEVVTAVRNIRGENSIKPGVKIGVRLAPNDDKTQKILSGNKTAIMNLAGIENCEIGEAGSLAKCAVTPVRLSNAQVDVIIPLEGLVDIDEEVKRLNKAIEKLQKDVNILSKKLDNENFVKNAPEEVVIADKHLLSQHKGRIERLQESLLRLQ